MDAEYLQEKAAICLRLADELPLNHPARVQLLNMAKDFQRRATELGAAAQPLQQHSALVVQVTIICLLLAAIGGTVIIQHPTWFGAAQGDLF